MLTLDKLPDDILNLILLEFIPETLSKSVIGINKTFYRLATNNNLWANIIFANFAHRYQRVEKPVELYYFKKFILMNMASFL